MVSSDHAASEFHWMVPHLGDLAKAALAPAFNRPSGAGDPNRGYVDWEFKDGTACR